jgi:hypothetical protein
MPIDLHKVSKRYFNVRHYGASGSKQATTGSITNGSTSLTVASAIDFEVGQRVAIKGASSGTYDQWHVSEITAIAGTTITIQNAATATVSGVTVTHCDMDAIQEAIDAAWAVSGVVLVPNGVYQLCKTPLLTRSGGAYDLMHLIIPYAPYNAAASAHKNLTIEFESLPNTEAQFLLDTTLPENGAQFRSLYQDDNILGSFILGFQRSPVSGTFEDFNYTQVHLKNVCCVVCNEDDASAVFAPYMGGVDLQKITKATVENYFARVSSAFSDTVSPAGTGSIGLRMPTTNAHATNECMGACFVAGFEVGFELSEHFRGEHLLALGNYYALKINNSYPCTIQHLTTEGNKYNVVFSNSPSSLALLAWSGEDYTGADKWYQIVKDAHYLAGTPSQISLVVSKFAVHAHGGGVRALDYTSGMDIVVMSDENGFSHKPVNSYTTGGRPTVLRDYVLGYNTTTAQMELLMKDGTVLKTW